MESAHLFFEGIPPPLIARSRKGLGAARREPEVAAGALEFLSELLAAAGIDAGRYRRRALHRRLPACLRFLRASSVEEARERVQREPGLARAALSVVLLGVSEFFRDPAVFAHLERAVLPDLLGRNEKLRVWSAGCAGGHELYSVAMMLAEAGRLSDCELVGTDCRPDAIEQARTGVYPWDTVATLPADRRTRFVTRIGHAGVIRPELRQAIFWRAADLLQAPEPGPWHLILWRNVAIYLEPGPAGDVWKLLAGQLVEGGYVVTGRADHPQPFGPVVRLTSCLYQRRAWLP